MKTIVIEATTCPSCGKPMPAGALAGLCPACLLAQGVAAESSEGGRAGRFVPPPLEEIAKLFPQLEILGLLGAGGMGAVYKARQPALDRIVALKVLPSHNAEGVNFAERFNREARALARLNHPNIVAVYEFGDAGGLHFFIMEFVDGANLRQLEQAGRLAPREALQIIPQICDALQYAHDEGVVHRDIKPENVLMDRKGRVKIADFGLAKILGQETDALRLTAEGQVMGTPHYMAPEQVEKPLSVDHRADIYALGVVFYEMLTGDLPLGKFSPPSRKYQLDVRLDEVVLRALENDPARRYQQVSEVKTQVENIAGTPAPAAASAPAPKQNFIRWAGFPVVVERDGTRKVNRKEALKAFGILFGVLTIVFGVVSIATGGRTFFGWLGISGAMSLQVRLLVAAIVVAGGVWRALRSKPVAEVLPQTPQGTVILPPERFSRKAIIGACWIPFVTFAMATMVALPMAQAATRSGPAWWQIALAILTLPLAFTAPFGATILGWLAVSDIRRSRGRISGLPLAVFDGLFFPLLALDLFLGLGLRKAFYWFTATQMPQPFQNPPPELVTFGVTLLVLIVDFLLVRRIWRAVRLTPVAPAANRDSWWSRKPAAIAIGVACALVIAASALRAPKGPGIFKHAPQQVAARDSASGALSATLPNGGTMELLALSEGDAAPADWWRPDGTALAPTTFAVAQSGRINNPMTVDKNVVFRFTGLPEQASRPIIESNPGGSYSSGGGVTRDGRVLPDAIPFRMAWPARVERVTMRLGVSLVPWRTIATYDRASGNSSATSLAGDPNWKFNFHQAGENQGRSLLTVVRGLDDGKWETRIVAVDTNGVEHGEPSGYGTPGPTMVTWTYTFDLPLKAVREFRAQARPLHWVEFRDVVVRAKGPAKHTALPVRKVASLATLDASTGRLIAKLTPRGSAEVLAVADDGAVPNAWWTPRGEAIPETLFEVASENNQEYPGHSYKDIVFRWRDLPSGATGPVLECERGVSGSTGGTVRRDGKLLDRAWVFHGSFPSSVTHASLRLGFGLANWQTIAIHEASGHRSVAENVPGFPPLPTTVHQISERDGEAQITLTLGFDPKDWDTRVIAVDTNGVEHTTVSSHGSNVDTDQAVIWTHTFWRLPLARVREFRVLARPMEWVEFRDIPLQPRDRNALGRSARPLVPTRWSAEKEIHITEYFDFDKGVHGVFPTAPDGTQLYRNTYRNPSWSRERGFDVEAGTNQLRVAPMFICDLQAAEWDTISVPEFEKKLKVYYGPPVLPSTKGAKAPLTHGFLTAEGAAGILQITSFDPGRAGVHLRYKLVERAHFE